MRVENRAAEVMKNPSRRESNLPKIKGLMGLRPESLKREYPYGTIVGATPNE